MAAPKLSVKTSWAWRVPVYVWGLVFVAALMRTEPDWDKVRAVLTRGLRLDVVEGGDAE